MREGVGEMEKFKFRTLVEVMFAMECEMYNHVHLNSYHCICKDHQIYKNKRVKIDL